MSNPFRKVRIFWGELISELQKASWPDRRELKDSTIVVMIAILLFGLFVSLADFSLFNVVDLFTSWAKPLGM